MRIGEAAPDFNLLDQNGEPRNLKTLLSQGPLVLYFYPKDETGGCIMEACAFRDAYEDFKEAGAEVVGVSQDSVESHAHFAKNRQLPFVLLSDPDMKLHRAYGADPSFMGLLKARITFVIGQDGLVKHIFSSHIAPRKHAQEALEAIQAVRSLSGKTV